MARLNLRSCADITDAGICAVVCAGLKVLFLSRCAQITDQGTYHLAHESAGVVAACSIPHDEAPSHGDVAGVLYCVQL